MSRRTQTKHEGYIKKKKKAILTAENPIGLTIRRGIIIHKYLFPVLFIWEARKT